MIAVVDYGLGNLASVRNAFREIGSDVIVTSDADLIAGAGGVVLPGVGAAGAGMAHLRERGLDAVVRDVAMAGIPLLGLCLGMQLLFDGSDEGDVTCLGLISGTVRRFQTTEKVPHIGWNQVQTRAEASIWQGIAPNPYFYFVHSYVCRPDDPEVIAGTTEHGVEFCSAVASGTIWGTQFHPERSGRNGLQLLKSWAHGMERVPDVTTAQLAN